MQQLQQQLQLQLNQFHHQQKSSKGLLAVINYLTIPRIEASFSGIILIQVTSSPAKLEIEEIISASQNPQKSSVIFILIDFFENPTFPDISVRNGKQKNDFELPVPKSEIWQKKFRALETRTKKIDSERISFYAPKCGVGLGVERLHMRTKGPVSIPGMNLKISH